MKKTMNLDIKFDDPQMVKEFTDMLRDKNMQGVQIKQKYKEAEKGTLAASELMEGVALVINSGALTGAAVVIVGAIKNFFDFQIKKIELKMQENDNRLALEKNKEELASQERIAMIEAATAREALKIQALKTEKEFKTRIFEAEAKEDTERIKALANKK